MAGACDICEFDLPEDTDEGFTWFRGLETGNGEKTDHSAQISSFVLQNNLLTYFVANKMLNLSADNVLKIITEFSPTKCTHQTKINACQNCKSVIKDAIVLHKKVKLLEKEISKLGNVLLTGSSSSSGENKLNSCSDCHGDTLFRKILSHTQNRLEQDVTVFIKPEPSDDISMEHSFTDESIPEDEDQFDDTANCEFDDDGTGYHDYEGEDSEPIIDDWSPSRNEIEVSQKVRSNRRSQAQQSGTRTVGPSLTCCICSTAFVWASNLNRHMKLHEESDLQGNQFDCEECKFPALSEHKLRYHLSKAHKTKDIFLSGQLEEYKDTEFNVSPSRNEVKVFRTFGFIRKARDVGSALKCKRCDTHFSWASNLSRHMKAHEESDKLGNKFDCTECNFPSLSRRKLRFHQAKIHKTNGPTPNVDFSNEDDEFEADKSDKDFDSETETKFPIPTETSQGEPSPHNLKSESTLTEMNCIICNAPFLGSANLKRHMKIHEQSDRLGNTFDCPECKFPALSKFKLSLHQAKVHKRKVAFPIRFRAKKESDDEDEWTPAKKTNFARKFLSRTERSHDLKPEKPEPTFNCQVCHASFTWPSNLSRHMKIHEESDLHGNKFDCPECNFPTLSENKLILHTSKAHKTKKNVSSNSRYITFNLCEEENVAGDVNLEAEINEFADTNSSGYRCKRCASEFKERQQIRRHIRAHQESDKLGNSFDCVLCKYPCRTTSQQLYHTAKLHKTGSDLNDPKIPDAENCMEDESGSGISWADAVELTDEGFKCKFCSTVYMRKLTMQRHMEAHEESYHLGNTFDCPFCDYPSLSTLKLRYHLAKVHQKSTDELRKASNNAEDSPQAQKILELVDKERTLPQDLLGKVTPCKTGYQCQRCPSVHVRILNVRRHLEVHRISDKLGNDFDCPECKYPTVSESKLKYHMSLAHIEREDDDDEPACASKTLKQRFQRISASRSGIPDEWRGKVLITDSLYQCQICNCKYVSYCGIRKHLEDHDESDRLGNEFDCPDCKYPAVSDFKLRFHRAKVHRAPNPGPVRTKRTHEAIGTSDDQSEVSDKNDEDYEFPDNEKFGDLSNTEDATSDIGSKPLPEDLQDKVILSKSGFACKSCSTVYKGILGAQKHIKAHEESAANGNKYECSTCHYPALTAAKLRFHTAKTHRRSQPSKFKRNQSGKNAKWRKYLKNNKYQCQICNVKYSHPESLKKHLDWHKKSEEVLDKKWDCYKCGFPTMSEINLRRHLSTVHDREHLNCELCKKKFCKVKNLEAHMRMHKLAEELKDPTTNLFHCSHCQSRFKSLRSLQNHQVVHQDQEKPTPAGGHLCHECGNSFSSKHSLVRHMETGHDKVGRCVCEECGKNCKDIRTLNEHMKKHDKNYVPSFDFVCDKCGTSYQHQRSLDSHKRKVHDKEEGSVTPSKEFKCRWCNTAFPFKAYLLTHMRKEHSELYQFRCEICSKTYISQTSLRLHKQINHQVGSSSTGEGEGSQLKSSCEYCGKEFPHRHYVICHYRWCSGKRKLDATQGQLQTLTDEIVLPDQESANSSV